MYAIKAAKAFASPNDEQTHGRPLIASRQDNPNAASTVKNPEARIIPLWTLSDLLLNQLPSFGKYSKTRDNRTPDKANANSWSGDKSNILTSIN
jgi:hypothetical protein